jgi:hypothetical protein
VISIIKQEIIELMKKHVEEENIKFGDYEYWEEEKNKSILVEWMNTESVAITIRRKADIINLNVYYLENVPNDKDKSLYLENLKEILKEFTTNFNLNKLLVNMRLNTSKIERKESNNNNFISKINITGQLPL